MCIKKKSFLILYLVSWLGAGAQQVNHGTIDRQALVSRHNLKITDTNSIGPTQVGNGNFAYGFDITGMQTFNDRFCTMSQWSWHSLPLPKGTQPGDFKKTLVATHGRMVGYDLPNPRQAELTQWLSGNPHRFNLGRIGLILKKRDGSSAQQADLQDPVQYVNLWTGIAKSNFTIEGQKVKVTTICDPDKDILSFRIESDLIRQGRLGIFLKFPYASLKNFSNGSDYQSPQLHQTRLTLKNSNLAIFDRQMDQSGYQVACQWLGNGSVKKQGNHSYAFFPDTKYKAVTYSFAFSPAKITGNLPSFADNKLRGIRHWAAFWKSGAAIDLSQSKDPRWFELERRIILSQYVMAINAAGNFPPQETGLVTNTWYGRFHYEMYWWHAAHYALWDRWPLLNKSLHVYSDNLASSIKRAKLQGYAGARWPKCTGPDGREWPDLNHAWLVWQQPHPIFFAELDYRAHPTIKTIKKWNRIVENTADFLASYAFLDTGRKQYILGPPIRVVSENNESLTTQNPAFELAYWRFGLQTALNWRKKQKLPPKPQWENVLKNLSPLPLKDSLYEQWEGVHNMWTEFNFEHPAVAGIFGVLPGNGADLQIMENTYQKIQSIWKYDTCWGWDFPMVAMSAARLGHPKQAIDMLLHPSKKFGFDEHGFVGGGNPYPYFPSNGGVLYAVAMMTAGWDGDKNINEPGWPKDGSWVVRWEGLKKAP